LNGEDRIRFWKKCLKFGKSSEPIFLKANDEIQDEDPHSFYRKVISELDPASLTRFHPGVEGEIIRDAVRTLQVSKIYENYEDISISILWLNMIDKSIISRRRIIARYSYSYINCYF
jgi:hypothetical protein